MNTRLDMKESQRNDRDTSMVGQVGASNTIIRISKIYECSGGALTEMPEDADAPQNERQAFVTQEEEQKE